MSGCPPKSQPGLEPLLHLVAGPRISTWWLVLELLPSRPRCVCCVLFIVVVCPCMCADMRARACWYRGHRKASGIPLYHSGPYSLKAGFLSEPKARLAVRNPATLQSPPPQHWHACGLSQKCWEFELRSSCLLSWCPDSLGHLPRSRNYHFYVISFSVMETSQDKVLILSPVASPSMPSIQ